MSLNNFGYIDFFFLGIILLFAIRGFFAGFVKEVLSSIGFVLSIFIASRFALEMGQWFSRNIFDFQSSSLSKAIGFFLILLLVWIIVYLINKIISLVVKKALKFYLDKILGILFGALKGFLILSVLLFFVFKPDFMEKAKKYFEEHSSFFPTMQSVALKIVGSNFLANLPKNPQEVKEKLNEVKETLQSKNQELLHEAEQLPQKIEQSIQEDQTSKQQ